MSSAPEKAPKVPKDYSGCAKFGLCILAFPLSFLSVVIVEGASRYFWIALVTWIIGVSLELTISYYFYFIRLIGIIVAVWRVCEKPSSLEEARERAGLPPIQAYPLQMIPSGYPMQGPAAYVSTPSSSSPIPPPSYMPSSYQQQQPVLMHQPPPPPPMMNMAAPHHSIPMNMQQPYPPAYMPSQPSSS